MAQKRTSKKPKKRKPLQVRDIQHGARVARAAGRAGDDHLIHVNNDELAQMHSAWGEPSINPLTGLPEYGFFSKLGKTAKAMRQHVHNIFHGAGQALQGKGSIFGGTPLGTKLSNAVTGRHDKPITDQYGGMTGEEKAGYKEKNGVDSLGYSSELHQVGSAIGSYYAGGALGSYASGAARAGAGSLGASTGASNLAGTVASRLTTTALNRASAADQAANDTHGSYSGGYSENGPTTTAPALGGFSSTGSTTMPTATTSTSGLDIPKLPKGSTYNTRDAWYQQAGAGALARATALSDRPYVAYDGQRVAPLSANEQQAGAIASTMGQQYQPMVNRLQGGFSTTALQPYMNAYTDDVLNSRLKNINADFSNQSATLDRNAAATDAFRSGRTDLARARLAASKLNAVDTATADAKEKAFEAARSSYFNQGSQDTAALGAIASANGAQINALDQTGGAERGVRQAQNDFNYGQFLEARDWDVNNLNNLLSAIGAVNPTAGQATIGKPNNSSSAQNWAALVGTVGSAINQYYGSGNTGGYYGSGSVNAGTNVGGTTTTNGGFGGTYGA